jgi:hypothetical protein
MSNPLTGDFEAVLQVGGATINRLTATMHQNAFTNTNLPSFPHTLWIRIGEPRAIAGVRGSLQVQIGVPRIELIHASSDQFDLEVDIRARYRKDLGTEPMPEFIHGIVRARYQVKDIDPHCLGWSQTASDYFWIRVVRDSVQFRGTAVDDLSAFGPIAIAPGAVKTNAENEALITKQITALLATRFAPAPHPVSKTFRHGSLRSLVSPTGVTAVVLPMAIRGQPSGQISSLNSFLLGGSDFAIGISRDFVMTLAEPILSEIRGFNTTVSLGVHIDTGPLLPDIDVSTVYRVQADSPTVEWHPYGSFAVIKVKTHGSAKTDSILPNASFDIDQDILINFDAAGERLWLSAGSGNVSVQVSGLGSGIIESYVKDAVNKAVKTFVDTACSQAQPSLNAVIAKKQELIDQLRTIDGQANVLVKGAEFLNDGMILRGAILLTPRTGPAVAFEKSLEQDGFTALASWLPGGRIEKFEWSWEWSDRQVDPGSSIDDDRFVLRRPKGKRSRWQISAGSQPLPGIDGSGRFCLKITGVQIDSTTGNLIPVSSTSHCIRYGVGVSIYVRKDRPRLMLRDVPQLSKHVRFPQLALHAVGGHVRSSAVNTLMLYLDREWDGEVEPVLRSALGGTRRDDAGLILLVLFKEGIVGIAGSGLPSEIVGLGQRLGVATLINEDVHGGWSKAFALRAGSGDLVWRLLSPAGGVTWMHNGRVSAKQLTSALDHCLIPSPTASPSVVPTGVAIGKKVSASALSGSYQDDEIEDSKCPPLTLGRLGLGEATIAFVQKGSAASEDQLRKLASRYERSGGDTPAVIAVIDGVENREAEHMKNELKLDFHALADREGTIADRFGIRTWPTTIALNGFGVISEFEIGTAITSHNGKRE